jgi:hypothetical protein
MKKYLAIILVISTLVACDTVKSDIEILPVQPTINQEATEVFKHTYPSVSEFVFKAIESEKTWQTNFTTSTGKVSAIVDYQGEILDITELVGTEKSVAQALKQYIAKYYSDALINKVSELVNNNNQLTGYKCVILTAENLLKYLYFDKSLQLIKEQNPAKEKIQKITVSSTTQIAFDNQVSGIVKQFVQDNAIKNANLIIYDLADNTIRLQVTFQERKNGAVLVSEIMLSSDGTLIEWAVPMETELLYNFIVKNEIPSFLSTYLDEILPQWQLQYAVNKAIFEKKSAYFMEIGNTTDEHILIQAEVNKKEAFNFIRVRSLQETKIPVSIKDYLNDKFANWSYVSAKAIYESYRPLLDNHSATINHYQIAIKQNSKSYVLRFSGNGELMYQYQKQ